MAHVAKYAKAAIGHLCNHYGRSEDMDKAGYVIRGNENIDPSRTHLNYNLAAHQELAQLEFIHRRLSEVHVHNRKDVNVLCDWVVTVPKDLLQEHPDQEGAFFRATYRFLEERYGKENVVSAWVHKDETTPHIHFAFMPVVEDKKRGGEKLSAKERITKNDLQTFHQELELYVSRELQLEVHIQNEATKDGNKTVTELKRESELAKQQAIANETVVMNNKLTAAKDYVEIVTAERVSLQAKLQEEQQELALVTHQVAQAKEFLNQIPDWPAYNAEATHAFNLIDAFRQLLQDTFGRGGIFRNRKAEKAILKAVEGLRDMVMVSVSALRGFEIRESVPEQQQRSQVIVRSLEDTLADATSRAGAKSIPGKEQERYLE